MERLSWLLTGFGCDCGCQTIISHVIEMFFGQWLDTRMKSVRVRAREIAVLCGPVSWVWARASATQADGRKFNCHQCHLQLCFGVSFMPFSWLIRLLRTTWPETSEESKWKQKNNLNFASVKWFNHRMSKLRWKFICIQWLFESVPSRSDRLRCDVREKWNKNFRTKVVMDVAKSPLSTHKTAIDWRPTGKTPRNFEFSLVVSQLGRSIRFHNGAHQIDLSPNCGCVSHSKSQMALRFESQFCWH